MGGRSGFGVYSDVWGWCSADIYDSPEDLGGRPHLTHNVPADRVSFGVVALNSLPLNTMQNITLLEHHRASVTAVRAFEREPAGCIRNRLAIALSRGNDDIRNRLASGRIHHYALEAHMVRAG